MGISTSELRRLEALVTDDASPLETGRAGRVGKYIAVERLGQGGGGDVWKALDTQLGRWVALKLLKTGGMSERTRFWREAQLAAKLTHPNIAAVYEAAPGYIAMQLIDGQTLDDARKRDVRTLVDLVRQAAIAVQYAHEHGIIHRDLKPGNIMVDASGRHAFVLDFGLARPMELGASLTATGMVMGTPPYMSPEQARGGETGARTDVWSLGATLYDMVAGHAPFRAKNAFEVLRQVVDEEPEPPPCEPGLRAIIMKCLSKEPLARYATASALAEDLRRWLDGEPVLAHPISAARRAWRWVRRHRALVAMSFVVMAAGAAIAVQRAVDRRRAAALQDLATRWSVICERKRELRAGHVEPQRARRELAEAVRAVDAYIAAWPDDTRGYVVRARGRLYQGDERGAEKDAREAIAKSPSCGPAWAVVGMVKMQRYREGLHGTRYSQERRERLMAPVLAESAEAFGRAGPATDWGLATVREDEVLLRISAACRLYHVEKRPDDASEYLENAMSAFRSEEYALLMASWASTLENALQCSEVAVELAPGWLEASRARGWAT